VWFPFQKGDTIYLIKQIKKSGSSFVVYMPKRILQNAGLEQDDKVKITSRDNSIIIEKLKESG